MSVALSQSVAFSFRNKNSAGALANAAAVAGVLYRNGDATAEVVSIANPPAVAGKYKGSFTVPSGWSVSDILQIEVTADGECSMVWGDSIDVTVNSVSTIASNTYAVVQLTDSDVAAIDTKLGTPAGLSLAADIASVKSDTGTLISRVTSTVATLWSNLMAMIMGSGASAKFTATAMENAPTGGGGSGDAEQATSLEILEAVDSIAVAFAGSSPVEPTGTTVFEHLEQIQDSLDTYITQALATVDGTADTIVGFPATLTIGNSYTTDGGNAIHIFIRDEVDAPVTSVGTHNFTDPDFSCDLIITNSGNTGRVRATVTYVDPGAAESYLKVEISLSESSRAAAGAATMQCTLKWNGVAKTIATQTVTWVARI